MHTYALSKPNFEENGVGFHTAGIIPQLWQHVCVDWHIERKDHWPTTDEYLHGSIQASPI